MLCLNWRHNIQNWYAQVQDIQETFFVSFIEFGLPESAVELLFEASIAFRASSQATFSSWWDDLLMSLCCSKFSIAFLTYILVCLSRYQHFKTVNCNDKWWILWTFSPDHCRAHMSTKVKKYLDMFLQILVQHCQTKHSYLLFNCWQEQRVKSLVISK